MSWNQVDGPVREYLQHLQQTLARDLSSDNGIVGDIKAGSLWLHSPVAPPLSAIITPENFYRPSVFVWLPHVMKPSLKVQCPHCHSSASTVPTTRTRSHRVLGTDSFFFILTVEVECSACDKKMFSMCHPDVVSTMSSGLQALFPAKFVQEAFEAGLDKSTAVLLESVPGVMANEHIDLLKKLHKRQYDKHRRVYDLMATDRLTADDVTEFPIAFSHMEDSKGYAGALPPSQWLQHFVKKSLPSISATQSISKSMSDGESSIESTSPRSSPRARPMSVPAKPMTCRNVIQMPTGARVNCQKAVSAEQTNGMCSGCNSPTNSKWTNGKTVPSWPNSTSVSPPMGPAPVPTASPPSLCMQPQCIGAGECRYCLMVYQQSQPQAGPMPNNMQYAGYSQVPAAPAGGMKRERADGWMQPVYNGMPMPAPIYQGMRSMNLNSGIWAAPMGMGMAMGVAAPPATKRQRRPRTCQNTGVVDGKIKVCGLLDCPGRGGKRHCRTFDKVNGGTNLADNSRRRQQLRLESGFNGTPVQSLRQSQIEAKRPNV